MAKGQNRNSPSRSDSGSPGPQNRLKKRRQDRPSSSKNGSIFGLSPPKIVSLLVLPVLFAAGGYQLHQKLIVLPGLVKTPSDLPKVLPENHFSVSTNPERFWGTYRTNLYFGMRTRSPKSPLIGLMWYKQAQTNVEQPEQIPVPKIRHWCDQGDGLKSYGWLEHDGKSFGFQEIKDENLNIYMSFVKRPSGKNGGDWTAKVTSDPPELQKNPKFRHYLSLMGHVPPGAPATDRPNILAMQVTYLTGTDFEIVYESVGAGNKPISGEKPLTGDVFSKELEKKSMEFNEKFEARFGLKEKRYSDVYQKMGKMALSNMLGGIGYFHGYSRVDSQWNKEPVPYGPLTLFTAVPSRPFFPRGFLWDEGFHHLLISRWDPELSLEILGSWLDLMNAEGWIPREMILGDEAESKVPPEYIVQHGSVANPPMFFYLLGTYLRAEKGEFAKRHKEYFQKVYPRLKLWYKWLNTTQSGKQAGTFRWHGRNATTDLELNPKGLHTNWMSSL